MRNHFWSLLENLWAANMTPPKPFPDVAQLHSVLCCANHGEEEDMCWLCCHVSRLWTGLGSTPTDSVTSAVIWRCSVMHPLSTDTLVIIRCQHLSFQVPFVPAAYRQILGWKGGNNFSYVLSNSAQLPISPEYRSACSLRWTRPEQSNIFYARTPTADLLKPHSWMCVETIWNRKDIGRCTAKDFFSFCLRKSFSKRAKWGLFLYFSKW